MRDNVQCLSSTLSTPTDHRCAAVAGTRAVRRHVDRVSQYLRCRRFVASRLLGAVRHHLRLREIGSRLRRLVTSSSCSRRSSPVRSLRWPPVFCCRAVRPLLSISNAVSTSLDQSFFPLHRAPRSRSRNRFCPACCCSPSRTKGWRRKGCLSIRSLEKKKIPTYDMCFVLFVENPLQKSYLSHINPTEPFFRSNPGLRSFREHYSMCLADLLC
jgi:hypothetical protein